MGLPPGERFAGNSSSSHKHWSNICLGGVGDDICFFYPIGGIFFFRAQNCNRTSTNFYLAFFLFVQTGISKGGCHEHVHVNVLSS